MDKVLDALCAMLKILTDRELERIDAELAGLDPQSQEYADLLAKRNDLATAKTDFCTLVQSRDFQIK